MKSQDGKAGFTISKSMTLESLIHEFDQLPAPDPFPKDWRGWVYFLKLREPDTEVEIDVVHGGVYRLAKKLR